ncbi:uncharacterized protein LOC143301450 [Babylonia areolata]|uniref:uncharacterized protein LOC143301450 n=1 Tax=Babylonia areolata TaxID=304850 RepID=UPI003FD32843
MAEKKRTRLRICELNPHLLCALCGGYLIDATTIVECLHSFCKTCILRYLETSNYCPICEVLIHKKRPWQNIRLDHTLQNAVYKLVPALFKREMQRRRDFYEKNPPPGGKETEQVHVAPERIIFSEDEKFSVSLEFSPNGRAVQVENDKSVENAVNKLHHDKRFLLCPANVCIGLLKKFVRFKYTLPECYQIDLFYSDEPLEDTYTLMDVAYIYSWRRENVLTLYYSFYQRPRKRRRVTASATASTQDNHTATSGHVVKAKAPATSTNTTTAAPTTTTTTTSTVTIVEATDAGGTSTDAEGTKTTVSVSLPSSSSSSSATTAASLPLALSLPVPRPEASSSLHGKTGSLGFDEDEDDDDERPLIIVTDTPSASATPMETDMAEGESGVTIITHSKTAAGRKGGSGGSGGGGDVADGEVGKPPSTVSVSTSLLPPPASTTLVSSSVCSAVSVANIPTANCSTSSSSASSVSSAAATVSVLSPSPSAGSVTTGKSPHPSSSPRPAQHAVTKEHGSPTEAVSSESASNISQRQTDFPKLAQRPSCADRSPKRPRSAESAGPVEADQQKDSSHPSQLPSSKEAASNAHSTRAAEAGFTQQSAKVARLEDTPQSTPTARPADTSGDTERSLSVSACNAEIPTSVAPSLPTQSLQPAESVEPKSLSETSVPAEQSTSETFPTEPNLSESCTKPLAPSKPCQSKEPVHPKDTPAPKELSQTAESSGRPAGPNDRSKGQSGNQGENSKKEARPMSSAKGIQSDSSHSSNRSKSNSSSLGIFERIYTVTSNCTATGIKSIFKTTAIVPAVGAARRYSDVSGTSPVAGIGERRASTGGGGPEGKKHAEKDKAKVSLQKHKATPSRDNRSSLDALAHLTKNSVFSSPQGSTASVSKVASVGSEVTKSSHSHASGSLPIKTSDKRHNAKKDSGSVNDKPSSNSAAAGSSLDKSSVNVPPPASSPKQPVNSVSTTSAKNATAQGMKATSGGKPKGMSGEKTVVSSPGNVNKPETKSSNTLIAGDLRVKLPKCEVGKERLSTAIDQLKQRQSASATLAIPKRPPPASESVQSGQTPNTISHTSSTTSQSNALPVASTKPLPASGTKPSEDDRKIKMKTSATDKESNTSVTNQKKSPANDVSCQSNSSKKKEGQISGDVDNGTASVSSVAHAVPSSISSSTNSMASSKPGPGASAEKRSEGLPPSIKTMASVNSASVRPEGGKAERVSSSAGLKRAHSATTSTVSSASSPQLSATITTTNTHARLLSTTRLVTTSADARPAASSSSSHIRASSVSYSGEGPEAKRPKLSGSGQFSVSPHVTPTILSSSSVATGGAVAHRPDGLNGSTSTSSPVSSVSGSKTVYCGNRGSSSGVTKIRPSGNHTAGGKVLAPGQRVDSLLFKATNRMAAAAAAASRLPGDSLSPGSVENKAHSEKRVRSESVDSRVSFIKTFGGGRSSRETCVNPAVNRADFSNFSARHILSPMFYTGVSRAPAMPADPRKSSSQAAVVSSPRTLAGASSPKTTPGARDLSRKSGSSDSGKETKSSKESLASDGSRGGMDTMKLDIPRLSTSSRDSVFASDPESSPTPSPKYSDINRNPIKLEPGSKLCRRETWVSAENGGRRSTGSVGSPNSLGSGPGSPLETERSPARDARRPSDSELLLSQRWHSLHTHPHLLAIPHPRDHAAVAAVAALYNGHFKVPPAAKYLPLAPDQVPRSISPDPMPLDYSTSSSSGSSK